MAFIKPEPSEGVTVSYLPTPDHSTYDVGGQQVNPQGLGMGTPYDNPILNGAPQAHPIQHVAQLITDHANLLRQRLLAAHQHGGFAPQREAAPGVDIETLMAGLPAATKSSQYSHLAALLAKFQGSR